MAAISLIVNNKTYSVDADPDMPLLWVLRDLLDLTGTKYGCGMATCGVCMVLLDGNSVYSCQRSVGSCANKKITTIEGLSEDGTHPLQKAWEKIVVPQCGYCQSGQMIAAAGMLNKNKRPTEEMISQVMRDNLCRCGTYHRIREAIHMAMEEINK